MCSWPLIILIIRFHVSLRAGDTVNEANYMRLLSALANLTEKKMAGI